MTPKVVRSRLGRGLNSLISISATVPEVEAPMPAINEPMAASQAVDSRFEIPIGKIAANPSQPRRSFDDTLLNQLAESLKTSGLIQPIIVRTVAGGYELIAGERRLRASKLAGFTTIPAVIRDVDHLTQAQM